MHVNAHLLFLFMYYLVNINGMCLIVQFFATYTLVKRDVNIFD